MMITGIILAGGKSSRMGTAKSLLKWKDKTLIEHAIDILKPICKNVIISSNNTVYDFTGCEIWPDEIPEQAPMIGIYSCLKKSHTEINLVLSCDMPLVGTDLFTHLLQNSQNQKIVVPSYNTKIEPLCGVYSKAALPDLEEYIIRKNYRLYECILATSAQIIEILPSFPFYKPDMFSNINTKELYNQLLSH